MESSNYLYPNVDSGRFFISPILGCSGACSYCYLKIRNYISPRKNEVSETDIFMAAKESPHFIFGKNGTIISIGAWGDIFPLGRDDLIVHSINVIKYLLSWGNPVQIMSKNSLNSVYIAEIVKSIKYPEQLLYSTTITSINNWDKIEPGTASPIERLNTCKIFSDSGVHTNVLLKPFMPNITDLDIDIIADLLLRYKIDYCTLGVLYWTPEISKKVFANKFLKEKLNIDNIFMSNHLDCNGEEEIPSTMIDSLIPYIEYLRKKGISAFLKSSCVNANMLQITNPSNYYKHDDKYCIGCGNCCI